MGPCRLARLNVEDSVANHEAVLRRDIHLLRGPKNRVGARFAARAGQGAGDVAEIMAKVRPLKKGMGAARAAGCYDCHGIVLEEHLQCLARARHQDVGALPAAPPGIGQLHQAMQRAIQP